MKVIYSLCVAQDQMTHGLVPVRGLGVGDSWSTVSAFSEVNVQFNEPGRF